MSVPCRVVTKGRWRPCGREHLPRQQGAYRVRNGVVHVEQVEVVVFGDFGGA